MYNDPEHPYHSYTMVSQNGRQCEWVCTMEGCTSKKTTFDGRGD